MASRAFRYGLTVATLGAALSFADPSLAAGPGGENAADMSAYQTKAEAAAAQVAVQSAIGSIPSPAAAMPPAAALDGAQGTSTQYARADHTHAAKVQRTRVETLSDGTASWTFSRPIVLPTGRFPIISNMVEASGLPITVQVTNWTSTTDGSNTTFTSVTVQAQQARALPATLLSLTSLVNYLVFQNAGAGVKVHLWAADPTQ